MADELITPDELLTKIDHRPSGAGWMDTPVDIRKGMLLLCILSQKRRNPDVFPMRGPGTHWKKTGSCRTTGSRSFTMGFANGWRNSGHSRCLWISVSAAAPVPTSAISSSAPAIPKTCRVLRAELLRSVYRNDFTTAGKILGRLGGARPMSLDVLKEWWYYMFQCTECRRCSVFCPYGIDTAEITIMGRELLNLLGLNIDWIATPVSNCYMTRNHLGIQPHAFKDMLDFFVDDIEEITASVSNRLHGKRCRHSLHHPVG